MSDLVAKARMLIYAPAAEVFGSFVCPKKITQFWLSSSSGPLKMDAQVEWQFMVPGATEHVAVVAFEDARHLAFVWSKSGLKIEITFRMIEERSTVVSVEVRGVIDELTLPQVVDATEGFSIVLCDLKTLLETGLSAHLVRDKAALSQIA